MLIISEAKTGLSPISCSWRNAKSSSVAWLKLLSMPNNLASSFDLLVTFLAAVILASTNPLVSAGNLSLDTFRVSYIFLAFGENNSNLALAGSFRASETT